MDFRSIFYEMITCIDPGMEAMINKTGVCASTRTPLLGEHSSRAFQDHLNCVAASNQPVMLWRYGETNLSAIAELLHRKSPFAEHPLATVSCRTNPFETWGTALAQLIDPHQPRRDAQSPYSTAILPGGTLLLDDLEFLPQPLQCLLYALLDQDGMIRFVGSNAQGVEVRIIAATTPDIWRKAQEGIFQPNLFSQLNRLTVHCPSHFTHLPLLQHGL